MALDHVLRRRGRRRGENADAFRRHIHRLSRHQIRTQCPTDRLTRRLGDEVTVAAGTTANQIKTLLIAKFNQFQTEITNHAAWIYYGNLIFDFNYDAYICIELKNFKY